MPSSALLFVRRCFVRRNGVGAFHRVNIAAPRRHNLCFPPRNQISERCK
jgi:hypothetical protein